MKNAMIKNVSALKTGFLAMLLLSVALAQDSAAAFRKWWPGFQSAVAKHDAKAVAQGMRFPNPGKTAPPSAKSKAQPTSPRASMST